MSEALEVAVDELKKQVDGLIADILKDGRIAELRKLLTGLNTLEGLCGKPKTTLGALSDLLGAGQSVVSSEIRIEPDEFVGLEPLDAAKRYLKKPKKAALFQDIVAAIRAGGADPGNEEKLRVSLARSTWDIIKIGEDRFGLLEFYPHIRRGKKKKTWAGKTEGLEAAPDNAPEVVDEGPETDSEVVVD